MSKKLQMVALEWGAYPESRQIQEPKVGFLSADGRIVFEVLPTNDGRGIEVRAIESANIDGTIYVAAIDIHPIAGNSVEIRTRPYKGG